MCRTGAKDRYRTTLDSKCQREAVQIGNRLDQRQAQPDTRLVARPR